MSVSQSSRSPGGAEAFAPKKPFGANHEIYFASLASLRFRFLNNAKGKAPISSNPVVSYNVGQNGANHSQAVIGVDIGGSNIKVVLVDLLRKQVLHRSRFKTLVHGGPDAVLADLSARLAEVSCEARESGLQVAAVGVGSAGLIDLPRGMVLTSPNLPGWVEVPLGKYLDERLQLPVFVENDVNCICYGEYWLGAGRELGDFLGIALGTGVGGCLIIGGKALGAAGCSAAEVGHMTIEIEGEQCRCGNRGCLETLASASWLVQRAEERLRRGAPSSLRQDLEKPGGLSAESIHRAARAGDEMAVKLFALVGSSLGVAVANVIHLLGIRDVLIGGGMANAWDVFIDSLHEELRRRLTLVSWTEVRVVKAQLGDDAGALGAAYLAALETGMIPADELRQRRDS